MQFDMMKLPWLWLQDNLQDVNSAIKQKRVQALLAYAWANPSSDTYDRTKLHMSWHLLLGWFAVPPARADLIPVPGGRRSPSRVASCCREGRVTLGSPDLGREGLRRRKGVCFDVILRP